MDGCRWLEAVCLLSKVWFKLSCALRSCGSYNNEFFPAPRRSSLRLWRTSVPRKARSNLSMALVQDIQRTRKHGLSAGYTPYSYKFESLFFLVARQVGAGHFNFPVAGRIENATQRRKAWIPKLWHCKELLYDDVNVATLHDESSTQEAPTIVQVILDAISQSEDMRNVWLPSQN